MTLASNFMFTSIYMIEPPKGKVCHLNHVTPMATVPGYYERHFLKRAKAKGDTMSAKRQLGSGKTQAEIDRIAANF